MILVFDTSNGLFFL